jgi:hypothetical protein
VNEARQALHEARNEVRQAFDEARNEVQQAFDEARNDVRQALDEARDALVRSDDALKALPPRPQPPGYVREDAEGLPVPIIPGTRLSRAEAEPPGSDRTVVVIRPTVVPTAKVTASTARTAADSGEPSTVTGLISATEERARAESRRKLQNKVASWLDPDVPASWTPPSRLLDAMILETRLKPVVKDYGTLYEAELRIDASPGRRAQLVEAYHRESVRQRLFILGGALAFVLICLGAVSGYIRADEATKGYYTNRLRMLVAAGIGAAGVLIYQMVA